MSHRGIFVRVCQQSHQDVGQHDDGQNQECAVQDQHENSRFTGVRFHFSQGRLPKHRPDELPGYGDQSAVKNEIKRQLLERKIVKFKPELRRH